MSFYVQEKKHMQQLQVYYLYGFSMIYFLSLCGLFGTFVSLSFVCGLERLGVTLLQCLQLDGKNVAVHFYHDW